MKKIYFTLIIALLQFKAFSQGGCTPVNVPYTQNFESASTPDVPACTLVELTSGDSAWKTMDAPEPFFPSKTLTYEYSSNTAADTWFYTEGINLTGGTSYRLTFKYGAPATTSWVEKLEVKYGSA